MADPTFIMGMCCPAEGCVAHDKYGSFAFMYASELFMGDYPCRSNNNAMRDDLVGRQGGYLTVADRSLTVGH